MIIENTHGLTYFWEVKYFPKRFEVEEKMILNRRLIYNFKDGVIIENVHIGRRLAQLVKGRQDNPLFEYLSDRGGLESWWLSIIPASTQEKTEKRFGPFCEEFCQNIALNNGYSLIRLIEDHSPIHYEPDRRTINIMDYLEIGDVNGKKILLFDDIYTTGRSFRKLSNKLSEEGAIEVVGYFLGKTHWLEEDR